MFMNAATWLICLGINLIAYGLARLFQVHGNIQYFYFISGTLFMTVPLAMLAFRCMAGDYKPKISWWGRIIVRASVPGGAIVFLMGYYRIGMSMSEELRRFILEKPGNQWIIGLEILIFLSITVLLSTLYLWDQSIWTANRTHLLHKQEKNMLYPDQELRYRLFHRNPKVMPVPSAFKVIAALTNSGCRYVGTAYAVADFKKAQTSGVSKIDLPSLEKEAQRWGQETLPKILLNLTLSEILGASDSKQILATTDIQGVPINLCLWYIAPNWLDR